MQTPQFSFEAFLLLATLWQFGFVFPSLLAQLGRVQQGSTWAGLHLIVEGSLAEISGFWKFVSIKGWPMPWSLWEERRTDAGAL